MSRKVFIKSIPRESAYNIQEWTNATSNKKLDKTKVGAYTDTKYDLALLSIKRSGYATGLYKPWLENGVQKKDKDGTPLTLQDYYERKHGRPKGFYHNKQTDPKGDILDESKKSYLETIVIKVNDGSTVLDLDIPDDELRYEAILESPYFANSEKEYLTHKWPKAQFYIALENESDDIKFQKNAVKGQALAELYSSDLTLPYKRLIVAILQLANTRSVLQETQIQNLLHEYIESSSGTVGTNIDKFKELAALVKTPKGRIELEARYLLQESVDYRVVIEKQGSYTWVRPVGALVIGETYSEAIEFLTNPKKIVLVEELKDEIKLKK